MKPDTNLTTTDTESDITAAGAGSEIDYSKTDNEPEGETADESGGEPQGRKFHFNIHLAFLCAIVLIIAVCVYKLYDWNKGVPSDYDPNYQTDAFDIEALDNIIPLAPDKLEGHVDDGVTTILCLGNDPFALDQGENGLAEQIARKTGATVYNCAYRDTTITPMYENYNDGYFLDAFSLFYIAGALADNSFDQLNAAASVSWHEEFPEITARLQSIDMDTVDILCIMYDGRDYIEKRPCDDPNSPYSKVTYTGALRSAIYAIQRAFPHIRIVVMSHTFCFSINEEGNFQNGDRADLGNGTLSHYLQKELDATSDLGVSFIDNFYGTINEDNYLDYMTDYIHLNDAGRELLADRFVECIFPELAKEEPQ